jgi:hypothetical protein
MPSMWKLVEREHAPAPMNSRPLHVVMTADAVGGVWTCAPTLMDARYRQLASGAPYAVRAGAASCV